MLNYLRKRLYQRTRFARQSWIPKNNSYNLNQFNELNFKYRRYGKKNPNKFFFVIRRTPGAGFFSNLNFVIHNLLICDNLKMIPIIDMENYQTFYNCKVKINNTFNSWNYYFKSVSKYKLEEVYKSKNVIVCDHRTSKTGFSKDNYKTNFKFFNGFQFLNKNHKKILSKYIKINKEIKLEAQNIHKTFKNNKILGICFRGTDSKLNAYQPHTPSEKQMLYATNLLLKKHKFDKIYLCTEDQDYSDFYKKEYGNLVIYNKNSPRTTDKIDLFNYPIKDHRYKVGRGNLVDMLVLSNVNYLLFGVSNIPYTSLFFSKKTIPHSIIDNGNKGGIIASQFSFYLKKHLPNFLGGFKNHIISKKKLIKLKNSDFEII